MNKVFASLIVGSILLGGCQQFMPLTADEMPDQPRLGRGPGSFYGGVCHYDNGDVILPPGGTSICP